MPKLARFYINFGNSVAIYSAGQNVQGYLNVEVDKPLNLQCKYFNYIYELHAEQVQ